MRTVTTYATAIDTQIDMRP